MPAVLLSFLLFFLPLIVLPFGISPFETPKVIIGELGIGLLAAIWIIQNRFNPKLLINKQLIPLALLFFLSLLSLIFFQSNEVLFGNIFRLQGVYSLWVLMIFYLVSSQIKLPKSQNILAFITLLILLISALILGGDINQRAFGTLGEPNSLAAVSVFLLPFCLFQKNKYIKVLGAIASIAIILLSGSRSGLIALSLELIFVSLLKYSKLKLWKITLISAVLILVSLTLPFIEGGGRFENRSQIWIASFQTGLKSPFFGFGFGTISNSLAQTSNSLQNTIRFQSIDSAHNILLDFWLQGGIIGFLLIISIIVTSFKGLIQKNERLLIATLLGTLVMTLFNPVSFVVLIEFWWLMGQSFHKKENPAEAGFSNNNVVS